MFWWSAYYWNTSTSTCCHCCVLSSKPTYTPTIVTAVADAARPLLIVNRDTRGSTASVFASILRLCDLRLIATCDTPPAAAYTVPSLAQMSLYDYDYKPLPSQTADFRGFLSARGKKKSAAVLTGHTKSRPVKISSFFFVGVKVNIRYCTFRNITKRTLPKIR